MIPALRIIQDAVRVVLRLPGASWALMVTDEDGAGDDPLYGVLTVVAPSGQGEATRVAIGGEWEKFSATGDEREMYVRNEGFLEITVEEGIT